MPITKQDIPRMFDNLYRIFSSQRFLMKEGLGGEIPFFIQSFLPQHQIEVDKQIKHLIKRLSVEDIEVLEVDLFRLCIQILKEQQIFEVSLKNEQSDKKALY